MNEESAAAGAQDEQTPEKRLDAGDAQTGAGEATSVQSDSEPHRRSLRIQLIVFCAMLILALIGMGVTESLEDGGWEYWIFLVVIYGLVSVVLSWQRAKQRGEPIWRTIHQHVFHWVGVLISLKILFLLEKTDVMSREAVSDVAVIILALACYLAGIHFQWMFLIVGIFIGIMAITLAYAEQYVVWIIMIPVAAGATWLYVKFRFVRAPMDHPMDRAQMSDDPAIALSRIAWQKLLIWGLFLLVIYYLRELFLIVFITFLMSYIIRNVVAALKNRIAPGAERPWLDRGLTLATYAGLLVCLGAVFVLVGPRFLQQSRLLLVQLEGIRPQDSWNSLLDRTVGVYMLRRTCGKPGDEQYDEMFQKYQQQGRFGEGLYHDFPTLRSDLESGFKLAYEQTESQRAYDELARAGAASEQFDQWFLEAKAPELFAKNRDSYLARWSAQYATPEKSQELAALKKQDDFDQIREEQIRARILEDIKADPVTRVELEREWQAATVARHWSQIKKSPEIQSKFKMFYEDRRSADPTAVPLPYDLYVSLSAAYPQGKAQFAKVLQAYTSHTTESRAQMQEDFERATRRELARKWWTTDPAAASLREHVQQDAPQVAESFAIRIEEATRSLIALPAQLVTALLLTIFITLDFNKLKHGCQSLRDTRIGDIFDEIATGLVILARLIGKSFSAQGVIALFNTLLTFMLLWVLGIRNELLFCAIVFIASFIPVVGVFMSGIPITIQAILQPGGSIGLAGQVVVGIMLIHLIEASVLSPKIVGKVLHLQPVMVLAILAVGEHLFGIWGLLLGVPVAVYIFRVVLLREPIPGVYEPSSAGNTPQE